MPLYREVAAVFFQHLGAPWNGPASSSANSVLADYFGALLPGYNGFELVGFRSDPVRTLYASNVPGVQTVEPLPQQSTDFSRARVSPSAWWEPQVFDLSPDPAVTFVVAWGARGNMGTGFDVQ